MAKVENAPFCSSLHSTMASLFPHPELKVFKSKTSGIISEEDNFVSQMEVNVLIIIQILGSFMIIVLTKKLLVVLFFVFLVNSFCAASYAVSQFTLLQIHTYCFECTSAFTLTSTGKKQCTLSTQMVHT